MSTEEEIKCSITIKTDLVYGRRKIELYIPGKEHAGMESSATSYVILPNIQAFINRVIENEKDAIMNYKEKLLNKAILLHQFLYKPEIFDPGNLDFAIFTALMSKDNEKKYQLRESFYWHVRAFEEFERRGNEFFKELGIEDV